MKQFSVMANIKDREGDQPCRLKRYSRDLTICDDKANLEPQPGGAGENGTGVMP